MIAMTEKGWRNLVTKQPVQFQKPPVEGETVEELISTTERIESRIVRDVLHIENIPAVDFVTTY